MIKILDVFWRFLWLGCISFGGPAAHIAYFQAYFVQKLQWLDDQDYAKLIALSQFLPGPASSQVGFAIGLQRAGIPGALAAFIGFTTPSFLLMVLLALLKPSPYFQDFFSGAISGLKLLAVVVVADACLKMFNAFCQNKLSIGIALLCTGLLIWLPSLSTQLFALLAAALAGSVYGKTVALRRSTTQAFKPLPLIIFALLFFTLPIMAQQLPQLRLFSEFYQAGSLVFGGGHVVLPLLQQLVGDYVSADRFLLGYAAAQAVPGPMFSLAAFLGADISTHSPLLSALLVTSAIFLPGFLLILSLQGIWESLAAKPKVAGAIWGINAAVVGLLLSALYQPVFVNAVASAIDLLWVILGFIALRKLHIPIVLLVFIFIGIGILMQG